MLAFVGTVHRAGLCQCWPLPAPHTVPPIGGTRACNCRHYIVLAFASTCRAARSGSLGRMASLIETAPSGQKRRAAYWRHVPAQLNRRHRRLRLQVSIDVPHRGRQRAEALKFAKSPHMPLGKSPGGPTGPPGPALSLIQPPSAKTSKVRSTPGLSGTAPAIAGAIPVGAMLAAARRPPPDRAAVPRAAGVTPTQVRIPHEPFLFLGFKHLGRAS